MINKINLVGAQQVNMKQTKKTVSEDITATPSSLVSSPINNNGLNALANYGLASLNLGYNLNITPVKPVLELDIDKIKGEKIYDSAGNLVSIISEDAVNKQIYYVTVDNQNLVDYIETIDKRTGNVVKTQHNQLVDGQYEEFCVSVLDPVTGNEREYSCYDKEFNLGYAGKVYYKKDGTECHVTRYDDGEYYVNEYHERLNKSKCMHFNKDKQIISYEESKETPRGTITRRVEFYNGMPLSIEERKQVTVPNMISAEPLLDADLQPAKKLDLTAIVNDILHTEGSETFYSNGKLESKTAIIDGVEYKAYYRPDNTLDKIAFLNNEAVFDKKSYTLKQDLGDGKKKETFWGENTVRVSYKDNDFSKYIIIDRKTNLPMSYREYTMADGVKKEEKSIYFNKSGFAEDIYTS